MFKHISLFFSFYLAFLSSSCFALTLTFDSFNYSESFYNEIQFIDGKGVYVESDVMMTDGSAFPYFEYSAFGDGSVTLANDLYGGGQSFYSFSLLSGGLFSANSFDILWAGNGLFAQVFDTSSGPEDWTLLHDERDIPYNDLRVTGLRNNTVVAEETFSMTSVDSVNFGKEFANLDTLWFQVLLPDFSATEEALKMAYSNFQIGRAHV